MMSAGATWGGSTAIWRETFDRLDTRKVWSTSAVDDIALYKLIQHNNLRHWWGPQRIHLRVVPDLDITAESHMRDLSSLVRWFVRQIFYIKFYRRPIWHLAVWGNFGNFFVAFIAPMGLLFPSKDFQQVGMLGLSYLMFLCVINMSLPLIRRRSPSLWVWSRVCVIGDLVANLCLQLTIPMSAFTWAGIHYKVDRSGKVIEVRHPDSVKPTIPPSDSALEEPPGK